MKELSIEEKAKAYDEAIERAKVKLTNEVAEYIFPELKESEGEKVSKEILAFINLKKSLGSMNQEQLEKSNSWIAWLEKLGEQKPVPKFKIGDTMRTLQEAKDGFTDGMPVIVSIDEEYYHCTNELIAINDQDDYEYPPMNRRQKPIVCNNSATIDSNLNQYCCKQFNKLYKENGGVLSFARLQNLAIDIYEWCRKQNQNEQNTAEWNEKDSLMLDSIISIVEEWESNQSEKEEEYYGESPKSDWLKSLKDRVQPQPKQEWCGGDEAHLHSLITHLEQWIERHPNTTGADIQGENIAWLKSLRPRSYWKPSGEHLHTLEAVISDYTEQGFSYTKDSLNELYEQLKAL